MNGKTILFPKELLDKYTTVTFANDVAEYLGKIIMKNKPAGDSFHIAVGSCVKWKDILELYISELNKISSKEIRVKITDKIDNIGKIMGCREQIYYDRIYNRSFDNSKVKDFTKLDRSTNITDMIHVCITNFVKSGEHYGNVIWALEGYMDKLCGEKIPIENITSMKQKLVYCAYRYMPFTIVETIKKSR